MPGDGLAADGDGLAAEGEGLAADGDGLAADGDGEAPVGAVGVVPVVPPPQATRIALPAATAENLRNFLLLILLGITHSSCLFLGLPAFLRPLQDL